VDEEGERGEGEAYLVAERTVEREPLEVNDEDRRELRKREPLDCLTLLLAARAVPAQREERGERKVRRTKRGRGR
jgi:hypothetical protein